VMVSKRFAARLVDDGDGYSGLRSGKTRTGRYGAGGSGQPTTFEERTGTRLSMPTGPSLLRIGPTKVRVA